MAEGARLRVWFDPRYNDTGPVLDLRDDQAPILEGAVGLRVHDTLAWFDDVVVLPSNVFEEQSR